MSGVSLVVAGKDNWQNGFDAGKYAGTRKKNVWRTTKTTFGNYTGTRVTVSADGTWRPEGVDIHEPAKVVK